MSNHDLLDDRSLFDERYHRFPRSVTGRSPDGTPDGAGPELVHASATDWLESVSAERERGFRCLSITCASEDGITWAANAVLDEMAKSDDAEVLVLQGRTEAEPLPWIAQHLGLRRYARTAQKVGITTSFRVLTKATTISLIVLAIVLGALASVFTALARPNQATGTDGMLSFSTIWYAVAAAAALLAAQGLAGYFKVDRNRSSFAQLAADLAKAAPGSQTYDDFVRELASSLATTVGVRVLLVDCFGKLDQLTREVLLCYLVRFADERRAELWVVFDDRDDGDSFDKRVAKLRLQSAGAGGRLPYGIRRVRYFNLDHLTRRARQDLAELAGFPERAVHVRVKAIVAQEDDRIAGYIGTVLAGGSTRSTQAVRVLYLLALTATVGPNPVWSDSVLKDALARGDLVRTQVLRVVLGQERLRKGDIGQLLADLQALLAPALEERRAGELRVHPEVGHYFDEHWAELGLPDPSTVHLYWSLFWNDYRVSGRKQDPLWITKHAAHLTQLVAPSSSTGSWGHEGLELNLFRATADLTEACLRLCLPKFVPDLLELMLLLLENFDEPSRPEHRRLRRLARDAYGLLGQSEVLDIVLGLGAHTTGNAASGHKSVSIADSLQGLFLESVGRRASHQANLDSGAEFELVGFVEDAELRATWLALTAEPFVIEQSPRLSDAVLLARARLPGLAAAMLATRENMAEPAPADLLALATTSWCYALWQREDRLPTLLRIQQLLRRPEVASESSGDFAGELESIALLAAELREKRIDEDDVPDLDFVRDVLAEELLTTVVATATAILKVIDDDSAARERLAEVQRFCADALHLRLDGEDIPQLGARISLIGATWRRLDFTALADALEVRLLQYESLLRSPGAEAHPGARPDYWPSEALSRPGITGLLAALACAEHQADAAEVAAQYMVRGVTAAIGASLGDELCNDLGIAALALGSSYSELKWGPYLDFLLERDWDTGTSRYRALLRTADDSSLEHFAMWFVNVATHSPQHAHAVLDGLRSRVETVEDRDLSGPLRARFDIFDLKARAAGGSPLATDDVLDDWTNRRDLEAYPFVLYILRSSNSKRTARLTSEVTDVLGGPEKYLGSSGVVLLAGLVARDQAQGAVDPEVVAEALEKGLEAWEDRLPVDEAIADYRFLKAQRPSNAAYYESRQLVATYRMLELDAARSLPELVASGRYAVLFLSYWRLFEEHGLTTVSDQASYVPDVDALLSTEPVPFARSDGDDVFRFEFLLETKALFESDLPEVDALDDVRRLYNTAARDSLPQLFDALTQLAVLPPEIHAVLSRHRSYTLSAATHASAAPFVVG